MSCSNCDCEECEESRCMNDDEEEEVPSTFGRLPPPPAFSKTNEQFSAALHKSFDQYPEVPHLRMNMPMLVNLMARHLEVTPVHWREAQDSIMNYIRAQGEAGILSITKGKNGGIMRPSMAEQVKAKIETKRTIAGPVYSVGASPLQNATSKPAINDHTCPNCGNTACSKSERSCWKCGGSL